MRYARAPSGVVWHAARDICEAYMCKRIGHTLTYDVWASGIVWRAARGICASSACVSSQYSSGSKSQRTDHVCYSEVKYSTHSKLKYPHSHTHEFRVCQFSILVWKQQTENPLRVSVSVCVSEWCPEDWYRVWEIVFVFFCVCASCVCVFAYALYCSRLSLLHMSFHFFIFVF